MGITPGTNVAGYEIRELLGNGPTGVAARARDLAGANLVLKLLDRELCRKPAIDRLCAVLEATRDLGGKQLFEVVDHGWTDDGQFYYVSEWIAGTDLATALDATDGRLGTGEAVEIAAAVADAVAALHERGLPHGALKPRNVLVAPSASGGWTVHLTDLGLWHLDAAAADPAGGETDRRRAHAAAHAYAAPEQAGGDTTLRSDVYSFGAILYELLAGQPPSAGRLSSPDSTAEMPSPPPGTPDVLARVVMQCLANSPEDRYPNAGAIALELRAWLSSASLERGRRLVVPSRSESTEPVPKLEVETGPLAKLAGGTDPHIVDPRDREITQVGSPPEDPAATSRSSEAMHTEMQTDPRATLPVPVASQSAPPSILPPVPASPAPPALAPLTIEAQRDDKERERSIEEALEAFVLKATASFSDELDGWDIASDIEQSRAKAAPTARMPATVAATAPAGAAAAAVTSAPPPAAAEATGGTAERAAADRAADGSPDTSAFVKASRSGNGRLIAAVLATGVVCSLATALILRPSTPTPPAPQAAAAVAATPAPPSEPSPAAPAPPVAVATPAPAPAPVTVPPAQAPAPVAVHAAQKVPGTQPPPPLRSAAPAPRRHRAVATEETPAPAHHAAATKKQSQKSDWVDPFAQ